MKIIHSLLIACFLIVALPGQELVPQVINTAGTHVEGAVVSLSYTIGEVITGVGSGDEGSLSHGFQEDITVTALYSGEGATTTFNVYPIPTQGILNIATQEYEGWMAMLFNEEGKEVLTLELQALETPVDVSFLSQGLYILKICSPNSTVHQSYEIIKL